jgi:hypothetical protein
MAPPKKKDAQKIDLWQNILILLTNNFGNYYYKAFSKVDPKMFQTIIRAVKLGLASPGARLT